LAEATRVRQKLDRSKDSAGTPGVLGASPTLARVLVPGLFESCQRAGAAIEIRVREAFTPTLLDWLERGMVDMAIVTNPEPRRALTLQPLLGEPFALVSPRALKIGPIVSLSELARMPLLMTSLHRGIVDTQLQPLGKQLKIQAEIDSVDAIRELVLRGPWATVMPVSVFKESRASDEVVMSEISGVQLNRLLVLATPVQPRDNTTIPVLREMIETEFARLTQRGVFSFASAAS
jgi:LysR family transcriptional regulator, nitrogen assimilation regulatory protein